MNPWAWGWPAVSAIGTLAVSVIAIVLGLRSRKYTNQLMAADQRKQASLLRVGPATIRQKQSGVPVAVVDYTVENASDEVFTEVWTVVTFGGGNPARQSLRVGLVFLPAKFKQPVSCEFPVSPEQSEFRVDLPTTFTDARDVRWRLDERHKLHRAKNNEGITGEASEIFGANDDAPVIFHISSPPSEGTKAQDGRNVIRTLVTVSTGSTGAKWTGWTGWDQVDVWGG